VHLRHGPGLENILRLKELEPRTVQLTVYVTLELSVRLILENIFNTARFEVVTAACLRLKSSGMLRVVERKIFTDVSKVRVPSC